MRDPLTDPVRGDVISYRVKDGGDSVFIAVVTYGGPEVGYRGVELYEADEVDTFSGVDGIESWRDWSDFVEVTVLRRGDA